MKKYPFVLKFVEEDGITGAETDWIEMNSGVDTAPPFWVRTFPLTLTALYLSSLDN